MKFNIIVADPPWGGWNDNLKMSDVKRGAEANYNTMSINQILDIPVRDIVSDDGALLALWVPSSMLQQGLDVMKSWGFTHKQTYVWVKIKKEQSILKNICSKVFTFNEILGFGMGRLFRQTHEMCLIGISDNKLYKLLKNKSQRSVCLDFNEGHSVKPESLQNSLDIMFPGTSKVELFSRRQRKDWFCLGNESPMTSSEDINISIKKLNNDLSLISSIIHCYNDSKKEELFETWKKISILDCINNEQKNIIT